MSEGPVVATVYLHNCL